MPSPYKLVIFDFDGTLADSMHWFVGVFNEVARKFHFKQLTPEEMEAMRHVDARTVIKHLGVPMWKMPAIATYVRSHMATQLDQIALFEGIGPVLEALSRAGIQTAVVSSNSVENVRQVLGPTYAGLIDHYACGASIFGKPAKFRKVLAAAGVQRDEVLCVGDELRDLEAAQKEGLAFGAVGWGYTKPEAFAAAPAAFVFERVPEIAERLV